MNVKRERTWRNPRGKKWEKRENKKEEGKEKRDTARAEFPKRVKEIRDGGGMKEAEEKEDDDDEGR